MTKTPNELSRTLLVGASLVVAASFSTGCDSEAVAARDFSLDRSHTVRHVACEDFVVPHGFALGWKRFNHRISQWGVGLDQDDCAARAVEVTHVGGVFSNDLIGDEPWARFLYQRARADDDVSVARVSIRDVVHSEGKTTGRVEFDLDELGLGSKSHVVAMIEGIRYDTAINQSPDYPGLYSPARGYTIHGLGAEVDVARVGRMASVDYTIHFGTGPSPERFFMNRTLPHARVGAELDVLIVGSDGSRVTRGDTSYSMRHPRPLPFADPKLPEADERERTVDVQGRSDAPRGFYGLDRFHFQLTFESECSVDGDCTFGTCGDDGRCVYGPKRLGEYMREFAVGVRMIDFDEASGEARFVLDGYTSNASSFLAFYPLEYTFDGGFAWVQAGTAEEPRTLEETFATGKKSFVLQ